MKKRPCIKYFSPLIVSALLLTTTTTLANAIDINVATAYSEDNFHTQNLKKFAQDVKQESAGKVNFVIHSGGALLKPADIFQGVKEGKAPAGEVLMSTLTKENPAFGMDALPFIVSGYVDARKMWEEQRQLISARLEQRDLFLLYAVPWPPQHIYSKNPIVAVKDFKGQRMRTYNPSTVRLAELIGALPTAIQAINLGKAIKNEEVDMMLTSSQTGVEAKAWTTLKHYYKVNAWIPKNMVFMSRKLFLSLDAVSQKTVLDAARIAENRGWKLNEEIDKSEEETLVANNVIVEMIDPYLRKYLDRIGENLAREWLQQGTETEQMVLIQYTFNRTMLTKSGF